MCMYVKRHVCLYMYVGICVCKKSKENMYPGTEKSKKKKTPGGPVSWPRTLHFCVPDVVILLSQIRGF